MMKNIKDYGFWPSPISAEMLASKSTRLGQMQSFGNKLFWLESRPQEKGRGVIVGFDGQEKKDITPSDYSVRTRAHEYGGGDFWGKEELLIFAQDTNQQLYLQNLANGSIKAITEKPLLKQGVRFADGDIAPHKKFTVCVRERHTEDHDPFKVINDLVAVDLSSGELKILAQGYDFYSNPRISPNGKQVCWLSWNHPNMPWDHTELWLADIDQQANLSNVRQIKVAAHPSKANISYYNPQWSAHNQLYFVADPQGWWQIYHYHQENNQSEIAHQFKEVELGFPQWIFGCNSFQFIDENNIIAIGTKQALQTLYHIDLNSGEIQDFNQHWTAFSGQLQLVNDTLFFTAANSHRGESIISLNLQNGEADDLLTGENDTSLPVISKAQHMTFSTTNGEQAYGYFYPPANQYYQAQKTEQKPPLIVMSHGGPTAMTNNGFNLQIQYWTSRGFAVADVNYRGSTGYGRAYRDSLRGKWGEYDVDDCIAMAKHLAQQGLVDASKMAIRGGSAGGLTTLCALTFHDVFQAGMSRYGVADLVSLAKDSHKFEIRYLDSLVGVLPQAMDIYKARSPIEHTEQLSCPILLLQGSDDKVVPPSQAEAMVKALNKKGLPYQYIEFEGEGHGFHKPETIIRAFEAELDFYRQHLLA